MMLSVSRQDFIRRHRFFAASFKFFTNYVKAYAESFHTNSKMEGI